MAWQTVVHKDVFALTVELQWYKLAQDRLETVDCCCTHLARISPQLACIYSNNSFTDKNDRSNHSHNNRNNHSNSNSTLLHSSR